MFKRTLYNELVNWKKRQNRKPLILRGARQVGKTTLINQFSENFEQYIYLNLDNSSHIEIFEKNRNFENIINFIFFSTNSVKKGKSTLIFIDEIQSSPNAIKMLRYFYEKTPEYFVIAAGSLLETVLNSKINFPVGRVEYLVLRPVSFNEFLRALEEENVIKALSEVPFPEFAYEKIRELFKIYTLIGGMPEVIANYIHNRDFSIVKNIHANLLVSILDDVEKYSKSTSSTNIIRHVIQSSFAEASSRIKFQGFGNSNYRSREIGETFRLLEKTFLLKIVYPTTNVTQPLMPNKRKSPKLLFFDTGIVNFANGMETKVLASDNIAEAYKGKIAEHIIGQELIAENYSPFAQNNFWVREKKQSNAEIDYLYFHQDEIIPVEVKSGSIGKLKSLHQFIDLSKNKFAVRFYDGKVNITKTQTIVGNEFTLLDLPHFLAGRISDYLKWAKSS